MQSDEFASLLQAGSILAGSSRTEGASDLKDVLTSRLSSYYRALGQEPPEYPDDTLEAVQLRTAQEALSFVEKAQELLAKPVPQPQSESTSNTNAHPEVIGTRDLAQISTLISITFNWAVKPLLARVVAAIPSVTPGARRRTEPNIIDLTTVPDDYKLLRSVLLRLFSVALPKGRNGPLNPSIITTVLVDRYLPDILRPSMVLGWLPKSAASESVVPVDELRPLLVHLINMIPVAQSITALSSLVSDISSLAYVRKACSYLLSRQILRQEGVRGIFSVLFSEEDVSGGDAPLEKLENVAKLLKSLPGGIAPVDYYSNIIGQLLRIISEDVPTTHKRAAAFTISRLLSQDDSPQHSIASQMLFSAFHDPLLQPSTAPHTEGRPPPATRMTALQTVKSLETLLVNTDPSPLLISGILTPIIPSLFTLLSKLEKVKISDPALKTTVRGLLNTWGRLVETTEGIATLWYIVDGEGGDWSVDVVGEIARVESSEEPQELLLFTPEDLKRAEESGELDIDANIMHLRPDPAQFVAFMKSLDRTDIVSEIFVRLLDAYREAKTLKDADPMKTLLYLEIIMKLQSQTDAGESSFNIMKQPEQILSFVKSALDSTSEAHVKPDLKARREPHKGLSLADLRIVDNEEEAVESDSGDSDDEDEGGTEDEMTSTALNLLLSVLEANPDLSTQNAPILDEIFTQLERFAKQASENIKPLAREARMVLVARLASSSIPKKRTAGSDDTPEKKYQKALKLLQDPILPVRAHGLLLLRELVSTKKGPSGAIQKPDIDPALVPGILSIFLQSNQDDDSYIFLNAVQGLSAMVDGFGKDVLKGLLDMYSKGLDGATESTMSREDMDSRTRVGEALGQVIRRCGDALPNYVNMLVPPLFAVVRGSHFPAALRTSSLSLLAQCVNTNDLALLPFAADLTQAMVDLLQVEAVPVHNQPKSEPPPEPAKEDQETNSAIGESSESTPAEKKPWKADTSEFKPTTTNSKLPLLRRAALHFLSLVMRAHAAQVEEGAKAVYVLAPEMLRRARITAGYIASTDEDSIARVMAHEVVEEADSYAEMMLDL